MNRFIDSLHSNELECFEFTQKQGYEAGIRTVSSIIYKHNKYIILLYHLYFLYIFL
jgi:hypothetical protein